MRIDRLAELLGLKYHLKSEGTTPKEVLDDAKNEITLAYKHHFADGAKEPVLQLVAYQYDEPWTKDLVESMQDLVGNLDSYSNVQLFNRVNKILAAIKEYETDPLKKVRNHIHDSVKISRQSDKNYRELVKSKFETALKRTSGLLEKAAKKLKAFLPTDVPLAGGVLDQQRKELSKEQLRRFMVTPMAAAYGLNNLDMMAKILQDENLRQRLTTIINAMSRGHTPVGSPELTAEVALLSELLKQKMSNTAYFEAGEDAAKEFAKPNFVSPQLKKERLLEQQDSELAGQQEEARLQSLIQDRDKKHQKNLEEQQQKQIEEDRKRLIRSEGVSVLLDKLLIKGIYENS
jgi:hypothetical protein